MKESPLPIAPVLLAPLQMCGKPFGSRPEMITKHPAIDEIPVGDLAPDTLRVVPAQGTLLIFHYDLQLYGNWMECQSPAY